MRVMLLGAGGLVGKAILCTAPPGVTLHPYLRGQLDITDPSRAAAAIMELGPDVILNAAGYTAVDRAESEPDLAFRINGEAVTQLGKIAAAHGARVVHFSTDYVFDGASPEPYDENATPHPLNVYGRSKLQGEQGLRDSGAANLIIRTQWLFGPHGRSFPLAMWERAVRRTATEVVEDQIGRPTYTLDLATTTWALIRNGCTGVYHVANEGSASWFTVAKRVFAHAGVPELLRPCRTADFARPAARPTHSALATTKLRQTLGTALPPWELALDHFLARLRLPE